jgi:hypothetical protein
MKLLFLSLLLGFSCTQNTPAVPSSETSPVPIQVSLGTDGKLYWRCQLQGLNQDSAQVSCNFHNESIDTLNSCIRVSYYDNEDGRLVAQSQQICSGLLTPGTSSDKMAIFMENNRRALQNCGESLNLCVMLAGDH